MPSSFFSNSSKGIMVSIKGTSGASVATKTRMMAARVMGARRMLRTTSKTIIQVSKGLHLGRSQGYDADWGHALVTKKIGDWSAPIP